MTNKKKSNDDLEIKGEKPEKNGEIHPDQAAVEENIDQLLDDESQVEEDVEVLIEKLKELKSSLEEMEIKAEEYLDGWQRSRAEFANYKKRILKEQSEIHQIARGEVIKLYLDITDDLERALDDKPSSEEEENWTEGIEIILQKLRARLESEGLKPMHALGQEFDPNLHEALMKEENEHFKSGQIIEVIQEGYWLGDKVLRPALVRVAA